MHAFAFRCEKMKPGKALTALLDGLRSTRPCDGCARALRAVPAQAVVTVVAHCRRRKPSVTGGVSRQRGNASRPCHVLDRSNAETGDDDVAHAGRAGSSALGGDTGPAGLAEGSVGGVESDPGFTVEALGAETHQALAHELAGREHCRAGRRAGRQGQHVDCMNAAGHVDKVLLAASESIGCAGDLPLQLLLRCTYCALCEMRYEAHRQQCSGCANKPLSPQLQQQCNWSSCRAQQEVDYSLHTALLLLLWPSVRFDGLGSSNPLWHFRHLASLLYAGAYSERKHAVAAPGDVCA